MRELKKNPNTRQPYSDVYLDLDRVVGKIVMLANLSSNDQNSTKVLEELDRCMLRVQAVLDPSIMTDADWNKAEVEK